jgi:hypothetical protein
MAQRLVELFGSDTCTDVLQSAINALPGGPEALDSAIAAAQSQQG